MGFLKDLGRTISYLAVAPINSVTGHKYNVKVRSPILKAVKGGIDVVHVAGKTYADTITGGLASKAVNVIRKDENKESFGKYRETQQLKSLGKAGKAIAGAATVAGAAYAGANVINTVKDLISNRDEQGAVAPIVDDSPGESEGSFLPAGVSMVALWPLLLLVGLFLFMLSRRKTR